MTIANVQGTGIVGQTKAHFGSARDVTSTGFQIALLASSIASAFTVGMASGFGMQFIRLVDKLSLMTDLAFYAAIIAASFAPLALVLKLAKDDRKRISDAKFTNVQTERESRNKKLTEDYEAARRTAGLFKRRTIPKPNLEPDPPSEDAPNNGSTFFNAIPIVLLLAVASYVFLGRQYSMYFWMFTVPFLSLLAWLGSWSTRLSGAVVCALLFGILHAEALRASPPDTVLDLGSGAKQEVTTVMTTASGIVALNDKHQLVLWPWGRIEGVTVTSTGSELMQHVRQQITAHERH